MSGSARRRLADGRSDQLAAEEPLLLEIHGQPLLTMRTPGRDEDLALGFLLAEGIVDDPAAVRSIELRPQDGDEPDRAIVTLQSGPDALARTRLQRTHEIRSSCGVCGAADLHALLDDAPALLPGVPRIAGDLLNELIRELRRHQPLFEATGGCHGALLADARGHVLATAEDVGRHNALDKAIGQAARAGVAFPQTIAVLSGRVGFDLAIKCLRLRIAVIASVSAPSSLAFDLCEAAGATLVGFVREGRREVYCDSGRLPTTDTEGD